MLRLTARMLIERVNANDADDNPAAMAEMHRLWERAKSHDTPEEPATSAKDFAHSWTYGLAGEPVETWVARDDAQSPIVAGCNLILVDTDSTHAAALKLVVSPEQRRRGYGRRLLSHAAQRARASGRRILFGDAPKHSAGDAFAVWAEAKRASEERRSMLDLGTVDAEEHAGLRREAEQTAAGYRLLYWDGPVPDAHIAQYVTLLESINDAPTDDLDLADEVWTPERLRAAERGSTLRGRRSYVLVARHEASGELAAMTEVSVPPAPEGVAGQGLTVVTREHRGHRLGMLVKLAMLEWLAKREPDLRKINTWNASSNEHMLRVNTAMGFQTVRRDTNWQLDLTTSSWGT